MTLSIRIAKLNSTVDFDESALPRESFVYALNYGLTQAVNDAAASIVRKNFETDEAFVAAVTTKTEKRIEQIRSGNVPSARVPADPKTAAARKHAAELMKVEATDAEVAAALEFIRKARAKAGQKQSAA